MKEYYYVIIPTGCAPNMQYDLLDNLFIVPICSDESEFCSAIALCKEIGGGRRPIPYELLRDFIVFHCFISVSGDSRSYSAFEKNELKVERTSFESKEKFINSIKPRGVIVDKYTGDFDRFPPFYDDIFRNPELSINYRETFERFLEAKDKGEEICEYIRLYVFSNNLKWISKAYQNDNLATSLLYTILDALLGEPERCSNVLNCDSCGRETVEHSKESLAKYQNRKIKEILDGVGCDPELVILYQKLMKKINRIRGKTYHGGKFFNYIEEWSKETKKTNWPKEEVSDEWPFGRIVKSDGFITKELKRAVFSNFIKILLINRLIGEKKFYPKLGIFNVVSGTAGYGKKPINN